MLSVELVGKLNIQNSKLKTMQIGMMNDPKRDPVEEARWAADNGLEFLDLTIEGALAEAGGIDIGAIKVVLAETGLHVVGHTAPYLPFAFPVERVRRAAVEEVAALLPLFVQAGASKVNVHLSRGIGGFGQPLAIAQNRKSFAELAEIAESHGLQIVVEHLPDPGTSVADIVAVLDADPRLGFHLDVGHAFVGGDRLEGLLNALGSRVAHVHMSDNRGKHDDHMPLGAGKINWSRAVKLLKAIGYDGTVTLEVFAQERDYLLRSAEKLRRWWDAA